MKNGTVFTDTKGMKYIVESYNIKDDNYLCTQLGNMKVVSFFKEEEMNLLDYEEEMIIPVQKKIGMNVKRKNKTNKAHILVAQKTAHLIDTAKNNPVVAVNEFESKNIINIPNSMD